MKRFKIFSPLTVGVTALGITGIITTLLFTDANIVHARDYDAMLECFAEALEQREEERIEAYDEFTEEVHDAFERRKDAWVDAVTITDVDERNTYFKKATTEYEKQYNDAEDEYHERIDDMNYEYREAGDVCKDEYFNS